MDGPARLLEQRGLPPYFFFPLLAQCPDVFCAFSTRLGGISEAPYNSLNLGMTTTDSAAAVAENRRRFAEATGFPLVEWIRLEHGNRVHVVDQMQPAAELPLADAVITSRRRVPLTIYYADCVPLVLVDPLTPAVGLAHAGWRGTLADVAGSTVRAMRENFGTRPEHLLAGLGSSIGPCCFEVGSDVTEPLCARFAAWKEAVVTPLEDNLNNEKKSRVDLWKLNSLQLTEAGVSRQNIAVSGLCTACRPDLFFSYRRDRRQTGRLGMMVTLRGID